MHEILETDQERPLCMADFEAALESSYASTTDWHLTARKLVKFSRRDSSYRDVDRYLKTIGFRWPAASRPLAERFNRSDARQDCALGLNASAFQLTNANCAARFTAP